MAMDYDRTDIPESYDQGRNHGPAMLTLWMDAVASHLDERPARILDLGCGTGRFSDAMAVRFDAEVIGLDPSRKMLSQARRKPRQARVHFQAGQAEAIPLGPRSIDLVFLSMCFHHFRDRGRAAAECRRVLRGQGRVVVRTATRERASSYPFFPFFPASHPLLDEVLPDRTEFREIFETAGLRLAAADVVIQTIAPSWGAYADKLALGADSVLARLEPSDFQAGVQRVREYAARAGEDEAITEPIDLLVFRAEEPEPDPSVARRRR